MRTYDVENMPEGWMKITKESHPLVHEAFETISHDGSGQAGHEAYALPAEWIDALPVLESRLRNLDDDERQILCIGEESEQLEIASRHPEFEKLHSFLTAFFNDWETLS